MKVIKFNKQDDGSLKLDTVEEPIRPPAMQKQIPHTHPENRRWLRAFQISDTHLMLKRNGCPAVGIAVDDLVAMMSGVEPKVSWPPQVTKHPTFASPTVETKRSCEFHCTVKYQWQKNELPNNWVDVAGETDATLKTDKVGIYRCVVMDSAGSNASGFFKIPHKFQWQHSKDGTTWLDVPNETSRNLKCKVPGQYRLTCSNDDKWVIVPRTILANPTE